MSNIASLRFRVALLGATSSGKTSFVRKACNLPFDENLNETDNIIQINHIQLKDPTGLSAPFRIDFHDIGATAVEEGIEPSLSSVPSHHPSSYHYRWEQLLHDTDAIILCYDITDMTSFLTATAIYMQRIHQFYQNNYKNTITTNNNNNSHTNNPSSSSSSSVPIVLLLGCKVDLDTGGNNDNGNSSSSSSSSSISTLSHSSLATKEEEDTSSIPYRQVTFQQGETTAAAHGAFFMEISSKTNVNIDLTLTILRIRLQQLASRQGLSVLNSSNNNDDSDNATNTTIVLQKKGIDVIDTSVVGVSSTEPVTGTIISVPNTLVESIQAIPDLPTNTDNLKTDNKYDTLLYSENNDEIDENDDDDDDDDEIFGTINSILQRRQTKKVSIQPQSRTNDVSSSSTSTAPVTTVAVSEGIASPDPVFPLFSYSSTPPRIPPSSTEPLTDITGTYTPRTDNDGVPNISSLPVLDPSRETIVPTNTAGTINQNTLSSLGSSTTTVNKGSLSSSLIPPPLNASFASTMPNNNNYIQRNTKNTNTINNTTLGYSTIITKDENNTNYHPIDSPLSSSTLTVPQLYPLSSSTVTTSTMSTNHHFSNKSTTYLPNGPIDRPTKPIRSRTNSLTSNVSHTSSMYSNNTQTMTHHPYPQDNKVVTTIPAVTPTPSATTTNTTITTTKNMNNNYPEPRIKSINLSDLQSPLPVVKKQSVTMDDRFMDDETRRINKTDNDTNSNIASSSFSSTTSSTINHPLPFPITSWEELLQTVALLPFNNIEQLPSFVRSNPGILTSLVTTSIPAVDSSVPSVLPVTEPLSLSSPMDNDSMTASTRNNQQDQLRSPEPQQEQNLSSFSDPPNTSSSSEPLTSSALENNAPMLDRSKNTKDTPSSKDEDTVVHRIEETKTIDTETKLINIVQSSLPTTSNNINNKRSLSSATNLPSPLVLVPSSSQVIPSSALPSLPSLVIHNQLTALPRSIYELDDPKRILSTLQINLDSHIHLGSIQIRKHMNPHHTAYRFIMSKKNLDIAYVVSLTQAIQNTLDSMLNKIETDRQRIIGLVNNHTNIVTDGISRGRSTSTVRSTKTISTVRSSSNNHRSRSQSQSRDTNSSIHSTSNASIHDNVNTNEQTKRLSPRREFLRQKRLQKQYEMEENLNDPNDPFHHHYPLSNNALYHKKGPLYYTEIDKPILPSIEVRNYSIKTNVTMVTENNPPPITTIPTVTIEPSGNIENNRKQNVNVPSVSNETNKDTIVTSISSTSNGMLNTSVVEVGNVVPSSSPITTQAIVPSSSVAAAVSNPTGSTGGNLLREILSQTPSSSLATSTNNHGTTSNTDDKKRYRHHHAVSNDSRPSRQLRFATNHETVPVTTNTSSTVTVANSVPAISSIPTPTPVPVTTTTKVAGTTKVIRGRGSYMAPTQASSSRRLETNTIPFDISSSATRTSRQRSLSRNRQSLSPSMDTIIHINNTNETKDTLTIPIVTTLSPSTNTSNNTESTPKPALLTVPTTTTVITDTGIMVSQLPSLSSSTTVSPSIEVYSSPKSNKSLSSQLLKSQQQLSLTAQKAVESAKAKYEKLNQSRLQQNLQKSIALRGNLALKPSSPSSSNAKYSSSKSTMETGVVRSVSRNHTNPTPSSISRLPPNSSSGTSVLHPPTNPHNNSVPFGSSSRRSSISNAATTQALWDQVLGGNTSGNIAPSNSSNKDNSSLRRMSSSGMVSNTAKNTKDNDMNENNKGLDDSFGPEYDIDIGIGFINRTVVPLPTIVSTVAVPSSTVSTTITDIVSPILPLVSDTPVDSVGPVLSSSTNILLPPPVNTIVSPPSILPPPVNTIVSPPSTTLLSSSSTATTEQSFVLPSVLPNQVVPFKSPRKEPSELFQTLKSYVNAHSSSSETSSSVTQLSPNLKSFLQKHPILTSPLKSNGDTEKVIFNRDDDDDDDGIDLDDDENNENDNDPTVIPYQRLTPSQRKLINTTLQGSRFLHSSTTTVVPSTLKHTGGYNNEIGVNDNKKLDLSLLNVRTIATKESIEKTMGIILPPPLPPPSHNNGRSSRKSSRRSSLVGNEDNTTVTNNGLNTSGIVNIGTEKTNTVIPSTSFPSSATSSLFSGTNNKYTDSNSIVSSSSVSSPQSLTKPLFNLDIDIGQGKKGRITIYPNPQIPRIAETFITENSLPGTLLPKLISLIDKAVKNQERKQQQQQQQY